MWRAKDTHIGMGQMDTDLMMLQLIKDKMVDEFRRKTDKNLDYYGSYSNTGTPTTFNNIVNTANAVLDDEDRIDYCSYDMLEPIWRSEEHTSELQSHSFISYAVFCLKKKKINSNHIPLSRL